MQTNTGRDARVDALTTAITHIALGDDTTAPTGADAALGNELNREAVSTVVTGATGVATVRARFGVLVADTFLETGAFANAGADLHDRVVHAAVVKPAGVELVVDIRYEVRNP